MSYQPDWDVDRARSEEAERLYGDLRAAVLAGTAEVKRDDRAYETGNFYVEYQCRRKDGWQPSGLAVTKADTWVIYISGVAVALPVATLKAICRPLWRQGSRKECVVGSHPTKGVVIPIHELLSAAVRVHGAAHGAPTDEPPPLQPADTDPDIGGMFGDAGHPDTFCLPTDEQSREYNTPPYGTFTSDPAGWTS